MQGSPLNSFLRFFIGFTLLISLSFGITYGVNMLTKQQSQDQQTAAAYQAMIESK